MLHRSDIFSIVATGAGALALTGCATAQMHTEAELTLVGQQCGLAAGELFQDESEKRLLFLFRIAPTPAEELCVARWARKNHMHPVFVEAVNERPN